MEEILIAIQEAADTIATPNWADILSVCFSLAAVFVACVVAWRQNKVSREQTEISKKQAEISREQAAIADKQNRIALFEKRFEIYDILSLCIASIPKMKLIEENESVTEYLFVSLAKNIEEYHRFQNNTRIYLINCSEKLRCANFFFSEKTAMYIINVAVKLLILLRADAEKPENYNEIKQNFFDAVEDLDKNGIIRRIEAETKMI